MTALLLRFIITRRFYTQNLCDNYLHTMGSLFKQLDVTFPKDDSWYAIIRYIFKEINKCPMVAPFLDCFITYEELIYNIMYIMIQKIQNSTCWTTT